MFFETKIRDNEVSRFQLFRHITGKDGFGIKPGLIAEENPHIVSLTWERLQEILEALLNTATEREKLLLYELRSYISMTGQTLDLSYIVNRIGSVDLEAHREQFSLFLDRLDIELARRELRYKRENRKKTGLWESYGVLGLDGKPSKDPHFTIGFWDNFIAVYLTTKTQNQISSSFLELARNFIDGKRTSIDFTKDPSLSQFYIRQQDYRLVDYKKGQMHGERDQPFELYIQFSKIADSKKLCTILQSVAQLRVAKQFELGYEIKFFDFSKVSNQDGSGGLRSINRYLLERPAELIERFAQFIEESTPLFEALLPEHLRLG